MKNYSEKEYGCTSYLWGRGDVLVPFTLSSQLTSPRPTDEDIGSEPAVAQQNVIACGFRLSVLPPCSRRHNVKGGTELGSVITRMTRTMILTF